jgi:hypothetical protein
MAVYESRFKELGFYVNGQLHTFKNGRYSTEDQAVIETLNKLKDVKRVDAEEKPKPKTKKAQANSSAK